MSRRKRAEWRTVFYVSVCWLAGLTACVLAGCEREEKVLEVETPRTSVEVERNLDTGQIEVDAERKPPVD